MTPINLWEFAGVMVMPRMERGGRAADLDQEKSISTNFEVSNLELCASDHWKPPPGPQHHTLEDPVCLSEIVSRGHKGNVIYVAEALLIRPLC